MSNHKTSGDNLIYLRAFYACSICSFAMHSLHLLLLREFQKPTIARRIAPISLSRYVLICEILPRPLFNNTWQITMCLFLIPVLWRSSSANFVVAWNWGRSFVSGTRSRRIYEAWSSMVGVENYGKRQRVWRTAKSTVSNIYKRASTKHIFFFYLVCRARDLIPAISPFAAILLHFISPLCYPCLQYIHVI